MPNIKAISDLRNYASVLSEVHENEPVYLTRNGRGAYAIVDIRDQEEYERIKAYAWLMTELEKGRKSIHEGKTVSHQEIIDFFREKYGDGETDPIK